MIITMLFTTPLCHRTYCNPIHPYSHLQRLRLIIRHFTLFTLHLPCDDIDTHRIIASFHCVVWRTETYPQFPSFITVTMLEKAAQDSTVSWSYLILLCDTKYVQRTSFKTLCPI